MTAAAQKILYISPSQSFYGSERSLLELVDCLDRSRFTPVVALPPRCPHARRYLDRGIEVHTADVIPTRWLTHPWKAVAVNAALIRLVRKERIALVHMNLLPPALEPLIGFFAYLKLKRVPLIFHLRLYYQYNALERMVLFMGRVICVSEAVRKAFLAARRSDWLTGASPDKVVAIHDGRLLSAYPSADRVEDLKQEFRLNSEQVVGMVGAIERVKRTDLFLRVAREVKARHSHVKFLVVGDVWRNQPERLAYKEEAVRLWRQPGLGQDGLFIGYRAAVPRFPRTVDGRGLTSPRIRSRRPTTPFSPSRQATVHSAARFP